jgi:hypothetical protein
VEREAGEGEECELTLRRGFIFACNYLFPGSAWEQFHPRLCLAQA